MHVLVKAASPSRTSDLKQMLSEDKEICASLENDMGSFNLDGPEIDYIIWEPSPGEDVDWNASEGAEVILLVDDPAGESISNALRIGARAVLPSDISADGLIAALHAVKEGLLVFPESVVRSSLGQAGPSPVLHEEQLTPREQQILSAMAEGLTNKELAARFNISEHTVKFHVASILSKMGVASRTEAVTFAIRNGILLV